MDWIDLPEEIVKDEILSYFRGQYNELNELISHCSEKDHYLHLSFIDSMIKNYNYNNFSESEISRVITLHQPHYLFYESNTDIINDFLRINKLRLIKVYIYKSTMSY